MKFAFSTVVTFCFSLLSIEVLGGSAPIVRFHNGIAQAEMDCPGDEWALVKETMANATHQQRRAVRRLGGGGIDQHRELSHACSRCGTLCSFVGHGCARAGQGVMDEVNVRRDRQLQTSNQCSADKAAIDASLTRLSPRLSSKCQALLNAPRNVTCVETTLTCHIDSVSLWYSSPRKVLLSNFSTTNVTTFCKPVTRATFRADTNYNLGTVLFVLNGPQGSKVNRTATVAPYFMHGSMDTSALASVVLNGMTFAVGDYTLSVSAAGDSLFKTYQFRVIQC